MERVQMAQVIFGQMAQVRLTKVQMAQVVGQMA